METAYEYYRHRQIGWAILMGALIPATVLVLLKPFANGTAVQGIPHQALYGLLFIGVVVGGLFGTLQTVITRDALEWRFGIGLIRKRVALSDVDAFRAVRTTLMSGWGIRITRDGMLYNVSGFGAVAITQKSGKRFLLGSDEPERLVAALKRAIQARQTR